LLLRRRLRSSASPLALFGFGEQGVWFDPSDVANLNWRRNISLNSDAETLWQAAGTTPPTVALSQTYLSKTCAAVTFAAGTGAGFSVSRAERALVGGTYTIASGTTYVMSYEISFSRALTGTEAIGVLQTGVQGINSFTFNASNTSDLVGAWLRISAPSALATTSGTNYPVVNVAGAITASPVTVYVRAIQVEAGSVATDYQRITDLNTEVIERFPNATLYQDTAGTTPVTTTGQSVGLMLDKSKGLVLGSELRGGGVVSTVGSPGTLATFNTSTGAGSAYRLDGSNVSAVQIPVADGRTYLIDVEQLTGSLQIRGTGPAGTLLVTSVVGRQTYRIFVGGSEDVFLSLGVNGSGTTFIVHSVKELPGNHAVQATTANRPIYGVHPFGGRRNLLVSSQDFGTANWARTGVTVGGSVADPIGGTTAIALTASTSNSAFVQSPTSSANTAHTRSIWLKVPTGTASINMYANDNGTGFSVQSITLTTSWQRFSLTATSSATATVVSLQIGGGNTWTSGQEIHVWGAQLELGSTATAYQRVTDQYNVTEAGVSSVSYLFFDGVNDSLATPSINFTSTDKMTVWAGVRKTSDLTGIFVELSINSDANNGAFLGLGASSSYEFRSKGTVLAAASYTNAAVASPNSSVFTGIGDIGGDITTLRLNGAQVATSTGNQGTGNYGNYPLYIGTRGAPSFPFAGHLYSLIVRGAQSNTGQISSTETWVASRTGITI
jgi:hypothetical protein